MVEKVAYTMDVPKEGKEVADTVHAIVKHFKDGKDVTEAAALLPAVMQAVDGVGKVADEIKSDGKDELVAYLVHKVMDALFTQAPVAEAEAPEA